MLAQTIITIFTFAFAAAATPVEVEARTAGCGNGLKQYCCNTFQQEKLFGIIPVQVGISCIAVSRKWSHQLSPSLQYSC